MSEIEPTVIKELLDLRAARKIGPVWADSGRIYVSSSEYDPWGTRKRITAEAAERLIRKFKPEYRCA